MFNHIARLALLISVLATAVPAQTFDGAPGVPQIYQYQLIVRWSDGTTSYPSGYPASCSVLVVQGSGDHNHSEYAPPRPAGQLVPASGYTDSNGNFTFTFEPPMIDGLYDIDCSAPGFPVRTTELRIGVGGLVAVLPSYSYSIPPPDPRHWDGIGYMTSSTEASIANLMGSYFTAHGTRPTLEMASLHYGGWNDSSVYGPVIPWTYGGVFSGAGTGNANGVEADVLFPIGSTDPKEVAALGLKVGCGSASLGGGIYHFNCSKNALRHFPIRPRMEQQPAASVSALPVGNDSALTFVSAPATAQTFADVPPSAAYYDAANLMFQAGVTTGCVASGDPSTRQYCPANFVTRQEMAAFIVRAVTGATAPAIYTSEPYFADVPPSNPFFAHIQKLRDLGITTGCSPTTFCPTDTVPRWQMAIFLIRARLTLNGSSFSYSPTPYFADVPANVEGSGQPFPFIQRLYEEHITNGCSGSTLVYCPDSLVTRGDMASFIMRALFNQAVNPTEPQLFADSTVYADLWAGNQFTVTITGVNTNFQDGDTVTVPSGMMIPGQVVVNSPTSITATFYVRSNAVAGPQSIVVTSGGQNLTLPLAISLGIY